MKSWQRVVGIFLLVVSGVVIQQSIFVLRLFDHGQPGSGFMPFGLGIILAVAFEKRDASVPDIPTFRESGYDVVTAGSVMGVAVPKGTPKEIVTYLERMFKDLANDAEFQKIMKDMGQPVMYQNAEEYKVWFKQAYDQFGQLVKSLGIETR